MANNMTGVRLYRRGVKRKVLQDEELPSTSKIICVQDKLDQYSATFQRTSDLLTRVQDNRYIPSAELWTVFSRNNFTPSSWYNALTLCSPELPTSQPWPPPPNASPQKGEVVPYHRAKKVPPRLWEKQGTVKTARGEVSHWVLIHPGPPEEFDYFTALAESLPPLPSEALWYILNLAGFTKARERLKEVGFGTLHHALQPCSVCERLLAVKVNDQGEIESSGTSHEYYYCDCNSPVQLALHGPYWHPHVIHPACREEEI